MLEETILSPRYFYTLLCHFILPLYFDLLFYTSFILFLTKNAIQIE